MVSFQGGCEFPIHLALGTWRWQPFQQREIKIMSSTPTDLSYRGRPTETHSVARIIEVIVTYRMGAREVLAQQKVEAMMGGVERGLDRRYGKKAYYDGTSHP